MRMFAGLDVGFKRTSFASSTRRAKLCREGLWTPIRK
jgi:hypothetical protein